MLIILIVGSMISISNHHDRLTTLHDEGSKCTFLKSILFVGQGKYHLVALVMALSTLSTNPLLSFTFSLFRVDNNTFYTSDLVSSSILVVSGVSLTHLKSASCFPIHSLLTAFYRDFTCSHGIQTLLLNGTICLKMFRRQLRQTLFHQLCFELKRARPLMWMLVLVACS